MPKEQIRKRGRRKPKNEDEFAQPKPETANPTSLEATSTDHSAPQAGPSGLHPDRVALLSGRRPPPTQSNDSRAGGAGEEGSEEQGEQQPWGRQYGLNEEFPFGQLDPDLKGYFRTVEDQIKDWEGTSSAGEQREGELRPGTAEIGVASRLILGVRPSKFPQFCAFRTSRTGAQDLD